MKRRNFVQTLLLSPVAPAIVEAGQASPPKTTPQQQPAPQPNTPARQVARQPAAAPKLEVTALDLTADTETHFFTPAQLATLRKLGGILVPPLKEDPGAVEAKAPEFLDFLIGASPEPRQKTYQFGLDHLDQQAKDKFQKPFCDLEVQQADAILRPLLVARPWPQDLPADPLQSFLAQAHEDLRTATVNSREWADAFEKSGHQFSRRSRGSGYYWFPIDPISQG